MIRLDTAPHSILALSFEKGTQEMALYEFEALLIYGLMQTCQFYTDLTILDYAVPSHRLMVSPNLSPQQRQEELLRLGLLHSSHYILQGRLLAQQDEAGSLTGISVDLGLFDTVRRTTALQVRYYFSEFEESLPQANKFTPSLPGLQDMITWMASMLIGAVHPMKANALWRKVQEASWCHSVSQLGKLARAHYLNTENALANKIQMLQSALQEFSDLYIAHIELSALYKKQGNFSQAILHLQQAYDCMSQVMPHQRSVVATELGICNALMDHTQQAIYWWKVAIQHDPAWVNPYLNLAHSLESQNSITEAEAYFRQVQDIAPDDSRTYFNLARIYSKLERWDEAIRQYEFQVLLEPANVWLYSNLANCYLQQGQIQKARPYLEQALQLDPAGDAGKFADFVLSRLEAAEV